MAIRSIQPSRDNYKTVEEFKVWLKRFDLNGDGKISRNELREALRHRGCWFTTMKSGHALRQADTNNNGFVDDTEIQNLVAFAQKNLGMKISTY